MPARKKPTSARQKKADMQLRRAQKRGDVEKPPPSAARRGRGRGGHMTQASTSTAADASRRLESSFVKFSPAFLEEAKQRASTITAGRPIPIEMLTFPGPEQDSDAPALTVMKRPKWKYDMSKKEVEANEAGMFKKWLEASDDAVQRWARAKKEEQLGTQQSESPTEALEGEQAMPCERMPTAPPMFERNLEVWRQLWRVTEICQILLILLDSRCPPLHYPPSLEKYIATLRPLRKVIFVLTKCDISGSERTLLWTEYLERKYPTNQVVSVESYLTRHAGEGQGSRRVFEPHIPVSLRENLVDALRTAHTELCSPPEAISSKPERLEHWKPSVKTDVNWDAVKNAEAKDITYRALERPATAEGDKGPADDNTAAEAKVDDFVTIGLIGQPNVGKSSLLNALFGAHKVKASKTPGKTKHFQTMFWTSQVRLVDCPGLVFPNLTQLELQVFAGILPIAQMPAIPSSVHFALQHLPLEKILELEHPAKSDALIEDKRTWRGGMKRKEVDADSEPPWTTMDVLTAFAEKKGWITAKAGRPDVNRAGNSVLRMLAEGRIRWGFYPPGSEISSLPVGYKGEGICVELEDKDDTYFATDSEDESEASEYESEGSRKVETDGTLRDSDSESEEKEGAEAYTTAVGGKFGALSVIDDEEKDADSE